MFRARFRMATRQLKVKYENFRNDLIVTYLVFRENLRKTIKNLKISYYKYRTLQTERKYERKTRKFATKFYDLGGDFIYGGDLNGTR